MSLGSVSTSGRGVAPASGIVRLEKSAVSPGRKRGSGMRRLSARLFLSVVMAGPCRSGKSVSAMGVEFGAAGCFDGRRPTPAGEGPPGASDRGDENPTFREQKLVVERHFGVPHRNFLPSAPRARLG